MSRLLYTAVILAGGQSSRMGTPKAWLSHPQGRLIDFIAKKCGECDLKIYVSGQVSPYDCIPDQIPNQGPLGGIMSAVSYLKSKGIQAALFVPVDLPYLTHSALLPLIELKENDDAICYQSSPLPMALHFTPQTCLQLTNPSKSLSVHGFLNTLKTRTLLPTPAQTTAIQSTNTPLEWQTFKTLQLQKR
ncbi:MAG: molybdenum cofactor guanylyltransferase [Legionellales bacterium]|nr:molybdenum cofactor guanylyltransferase [Legionellales bacterium]